MSIRIQAFNRDLQLGRKLRNQCKELNYVRSIKFYGMIYLEKSYFFENAVIFALLLGKCDYFTAITMDFTINVVLCFI